MAIDGLIDGLTLARIKQHLQVDSDETDDDTLIQAYATASLAYVENYTGKSWAAWSLSEDFLEFLNPMYLDWKQEVKDASIEYTNLSAEIITLAVQVYADNVIRELVPDDYDGGVIRISYNSYVDEHQNYIAQQARLLMIGDSYSHREDTITGTIVSKLPNGVLPLLDTIKVGRI